MTTFSHGDEVIRKGEKDPSRIGVIDLKFSSHLPPNMIYVHWYDSWRTTRIDMRKIMLLSDFRKQQEPPKDLKHFWTGSHVQNNTTNHSGK